LSHSFQNGLLLKWIASGAGDPDVMQHPVVERRYSRLRRRHWRNMNGSRRFDRLEF
jgi:hypothetical protein